MNDDDRKLIRELLDHHRVLSLSLLIDGLPYAGLLPFAVKADYSAALVHASGLARHSKGLTEGSPFGAVIHFPDRLDADPLRLPRLLLEGRVAVIDKESPEYDEGRRVFQQKLPQSQQTFGLGDFQLYELRFERGRLVAGFGRASTVTAEVLQSLADGGN